MNRNPWPVKGEAHIILIFLLVLLVFMGLLAVENSLLAYSDSPGVFPRFQLPAPGEYRVSFQGREIRLSGLVTVGMIKEEPEKRVWLQFGQRKIYFPTTVTLFPLPR